MNAKRFPKRLDSKTSCLRITVPENLDLALEGLIRKVLREQPSVDHIHAFAADYFETLLRIRDKAGPRQAPAQLCPFHNEEEAEEMIKLAGSFEKPEGRKGKAVERREKEVETKGPGEGNRKAKGGGELRGVRGGNEEDKQATPDLIKKLPRADGGEVGEEGKGRTEGGVEGGEEKGKGEGGVEGEEGKRTSEGGAEGEGKGEGGVEEEEGKGRSEGGGEGEEEDVLGSDPMKELVEKEPMMEGWKEEGQRGVGREDERKGEVGGEEEGRKENGKEGGDGEGEAMEGGRGGDDEKGEVDLGRKPEEEIEAVVGSTEGKELLAGEEAVHAGSEAEGKIPENEKVESAAKAKEADDREETGEGGHSRGKKGSEVAVNVEEEKASCPQGEEQEGRETEEKRLDESESSGVEEQTTEERPEERLAEAPMTQQESSEPSKEGTAGTCDERMLPPPDADKPEAAVTHPNVEEDEYHEKTESSEREKEDAVAAETAAALPLLEKSDEILNDSGDSKTAGENVRAGDLVEGKATPQAAETTATQTHNQPEAPSQVHTGGDNRQESLSEPSSKEAAGEAAAEAAKEAAGEAAKEESEEAAAEAAEEGPEGEELCTVVDIHSIPTADGEKSGEGGKGEEGKGEPEEVCVVVDTEHIIRVEAPERGNEKRQPSEEVEIKTIQTHYYDTLQVPETVTKELRVHGVSDAPVSVPPSDADPPPRAAFEGPSALPLEPAGSPTTTETDLPTAKTKAESPVVELNLGSDSQTTGTDDLLDLTTPTSGYSLNLSDLSWRTVSGMFLESERRYSNREKEGVRFRRAKSNEDERAEVEEVLERREVPWGVRGVPVAAGDAEEVREEGGEGVLEEGKEEEKGGDESGGSSGNGRSVDSDVPLVAVEVRTAIESQAAGEEDGDEEEERVGEVEVKVKVEVEEEEEEGNKEEKEEEEKQKQKEEKQKEEKEKQKEEKEKQKEEEEKQKEEKQKQKEEKQKEEKQKQKEEKQKEEKQKEEKEKERREDVEGSGKGKEASNGEGDERGHRGSGSLEGRGGREGSSGESESSVSSAATEIKRSEFARRHGEGTGRSLLASQSVDKCNAGQGGRNPLLRARSLSTFRHGVTDFEVWNAIEKELEEAAAKIQARFRRYKTRKKLQRENAVQITTEESSPAATPPEPDQPHRSTGEFHDSIVLTDHPR